MNEQDQQKHDRRKQDFQKDSHRIAWFILIVPRELSQRKDGNGAYAPSAHHCKAGQDSIRRLP